MSFPMEAMHGTMVGQPGGDRAWEVEGHILGMPWGGGDPAAVPSSVKW